MKNYFNHALKLSPFLFAFSIGSLYGGPALQMNKAFHALTEMMPFMTNETMFKEKKNDEIVKKNLEELSTSFKLAGHDTLIKHDLFAPSYELILGNIVESTEAFKAGKKDYSLWLMKETVTLCMDCHGRLPTSVTSSFQNGELSVDKSKVSDPQDLGIAYMIVRRYVEAKESFTRSIQDKLIKKDGAGLLRPFQHVLSIELKIKKDPSSMVSILDDYLVKRNLPNEVNRELMAWKKRLLLWKEDVAVTKGLHNERDLNQFLTRRLEPLKQRNTFEDEYKVDLLLSAGILSTYFFENQDTPSAPYLSLWLGWIEKRLKKEEFMSSGDLFLKQCVRKYSRHPVAHECLKEYKESIEFDFTGSGGTSIPKEVEDQLNDLRLIIQPQKK